MTKKPSYRFAGYTEPWEEKKLGEVFDIVTDYVANGSFESLRNNVKTYEKDNFAYMIRLQDASNSWKGPWLYTDEKGYNFLSKSRLFKDDILMSNVGTVGRFFQVPELDRPMTLAPNSVLIRSTSSNNQFLYFMMLTANIQDQITMRKTPGVQDKINKTDFKKVIATLPSLPEQEAIGSFFQDIDHLISLQQRKLEVFKEQKKTYLKLLFPAKGQIKPALRFAGFEDEWKEVKLGEYCDIATGKLDANAMVTDGEYDFYTSGIQKYKIDVAAFEGPAITIAGNGATVGYMHYADGKFNAYQRTYVLSNFLVDRSFIYSEIGRKLPSKIQQEARTGNIPYIVMDMLTKLDICLPSLPEQEAIGSFFQDLDKAIAKHEEKVNQLKESKQTLLRKMFI